MSVLVEVGEEKGEEKGTHLKSHIELRPLFFSTSTSSSGTTEVSVDAHGNPIRSVDEQGNVTLTEYADPEKGLPSKVTRFIGDPDTAAQIAAGTGDDLTTSYTYNQWGQRTSETDARGNTSTTVYDSQGYPRQEIDVFGNATTYSFYDGQLYGTTDADGNSSGFSYDAFGNISGVTQSNYAAGTTTSTSFVYNTVGDLISTKTLTVMCARSPTTNLVVKPAPHSSGRTRSASCPTKR